MTSTTADFRLDLASVKPPVADRIEKTTSIHGHHRTDPYFWLREKSNPKVIDYIKAENEYFDRMMAHTKDFQETLYKEMLARIKETDMSVPYQQGPYLYYYRTEEGKQYRIYCRRPRESDEKAEQVILDLNAIAEEEAKKKKEAGEEEKPYLDLGVYAVSPNHKILAYALDQKGNEVYTLYFKNLETGELFSDKIENIYPNLEWGNDNTTVFYTTMDAALRPYKIWRHKFRASASDESNEQDVCVFTEDDERYTAYIYKTASHKFLVIESSSKQSSEAYYLDADKPTGDFKLFEGRKEKVEYTLEHQGDHFYVVTNADGATNFKLVRTPISNPSLKDAELVIPYVKERKIDAVLPFKNHIVIMTREEALKRMMIQNVQTGDFHNIQFPDPIYTYMTTGNKEYDSTKVRFTYSSLLTPDSVFDYDMNTKEMTLLKELEVLGGYDRHLYEQTREFAIAHDGTRIPLSIVHKKGIKKDGNNPCLLYGYGSYGYPIDPWFNSTRFSMLDRGFVYCIAHIRGGGEGGRPWYDEGKLLKKMNTFTDFIRAAEHLIEQKYTSPERLAISGGSAGGLLVGTVLNLRPDLFKAAVMKVPFVDVVNTMLDPTIPLTVPEYEEWGNPQDEEYYRCILGYSPYDNLRNDKVPYPSILITSGLNDPRVQFWEPTKYIAKLRYNYAHAEYNNKDNKDVAAAHAGNIALLKTNMGAGHSGLSGRYDALRQEAEVLAFIIDQIAPANNMKTLAKEK